MSLPQICAPCPCSGGYVGVVVTQGRRGLWDKGWESVEVLPSHPWGHQEEMWEGSIRSPHSETRPQEARLGTTSKPGR